MVRLKNYPNYGTDDEGRLYRWISPSNMKEIVPLVTKTETRFYVTITKRRFSVLKDDLIKHKENVIFRREFVE